MPPERRRRRVAAAAGVAGAAAGAAILVSAHPDDEALFFAPLLLAPGPRQPRAVLCLSTGDFRGCGATREKELARCCREVFGVAVDQRRTLRDGPQEAWPPAAVAAEIADCCSRYGAHEVATFDARGVSGHANHRSCHAGARAAGRPLRALRTLPLPVKYLGLLLFPLACVAWALRRGPKPKAWQLALGQVSVIICFEAVFAAWRGLRIHESQAAWFRYLHVLFSLYSYINVFAHEKA